MIGQIQRLAGLRVAGQVAAGGRDHLHQSARPGPAQRALVEGGFLQDQRRHQRRVDKITQVEQEFGNGSKGQPKQ